MESKAEESLVCALIMLYNNYTFNKRKMVHKDFITEEGEVKLTTLTLSYVRERIKRNTERNQRAMKAFNQLLEKRELNEGRMRKRNPVEEKILAGFSKR
ncbi:hypothetical protein P9248_01305 [Bacillus subtilis]|nr:hypothetical protein [Bacillus subtilis]